MSCNLIDFTQFVYNRTLYAYFHAVFRRSIKLECFYTRCSKCSEFHFHLETLTPDSFTRLKYLFLHHLTAFHSLPLEFNDNEYCNVFLQPKFTASQSKQVTVRDGNNYAFILLYIILILVHKFMNFGPSIVLDLWFHDHSFF